MDIHKPKPWHGWREFLKEYVIIVVGVLTALAAEQGVEWLHWRHKVQEGREAIRAEVEGDAFNAEQRLALNDCFEHRLASLQRRLGTTHGVWSGQPWGFQFRQGEDDAYGAVIRNWNSEVWRGLVADGTAVHFPRDEMLNYSRIYHFADVLGSLNATESEAVSRVSVLGQSIELSPEAAYQSALGLQEAKRNNRLMAGGARQLLTLIRDAGLTPSGPVWNGRMSRLKQLAARCAAAPEAS